MGVIATKSIARSIISYVGILIGAFSTLFIYPLDLSTYGAIQFLISSSNFFVPFASLGILGLAIRFFPDFKDGQNRHHGFFGLLLGGVCLAMIAFGLVMYAFKPFILDGLEGLGMDTLLIRSNLLQISALIGIAVILRLGALHLLNFKSIIVSTVLESFAIKIIVPVLILLSIQNLFSHEEIEWLFIGAKAILLICLLSYIAFLGEFHWRPAFVLARGTSTANATCAVFPRVH